MHYDSKHKIHTLPLSPKPEELTRPSQFYSSSSETMFIEEAQIWERLGLISLGNGEYGKVGSTRDASCIYKHEKIKSNNNWGSRLRGNDYDDQKGLNIYYHY